MESERQTLMVVSSNFLINRFRSANKPIV